MASLERWFIALVILVGEILNVLASAGDRSIVFQRCVFSCKKQACSADQHYDEMQPIHMKLLGWTCVEDCKYFCMWKTVEAFQKDGTNVPQFHGKWPFIRVLGVQEPASVLFSVLNGLSHLVMLLSFRRQVSSKAPMYYMWHFYALAAMNAWLWSTIFHSRDTNFTEMMDYTNAVLLVVFSMFTLCARVIGTKRPLLVASAGAAFLSFFIYHIHYLAFVKFDYGYNMKVNIAVGLLNSIGWLVWYSQVRTKQRYAWRSALCVLLVNSLVLLELLDFPPFWWTLDAHSLWHAGTAPVAFIWYRFVIDDCNYLHAQESQSSFDEKQTQTNVSSQRLGETCISSAKTKVKQKSSAADSDSSAQRSES